MPFYDLTCPNRHDQHDLWLKLGERPPCPTCGEPTETLWEGKRTAHGDECDEWIYHGICNEDDSPRRYYSKSEMAREADKRGLVNVVRHVPGSPHTTDWSAGIDAQTLENARVLLTRGQGRNESDKSARLRAIEQAAREALRQLSNQ